MHESHASASLPLLYAYLEREKKQLIVADRHHTCVITHTFHNKVHLKRNRANVVCFIFGPICSVNNTICIEWTSSATAIVIGQTIFMDISRSSSHHIFEICRLCEPTNLHFTHKAPRREILTGMFAADLDILLAIATGNDASNFDYDRTRLYTHRYCM